jgi:hypothetical protein
VLPPTLPYPDTGQLRNIDLAAKIVSWVLQALQIAESSLTPNKKQAINQEKESGGVGSGSATKPVFKMTPSSVLYASKSEPSSAKHSLHASDPQPGWSKGGLEAQVRSQYLQGLSKKPQATWPRHFGAITNRAPLHNQNGANFHPLIAEMFSGYTNVDSPPERRRAITPKLLRYLFQLTGAGKVTTMDLGVTYIMAELAVIGFFWAVRSCENVTPPVPGKTRIIRFRNIMFRIALNAILPHTSSLMVLSRAERVSVTFDNQKNGQKLDTRTHQRTGDGVLCPSVRFASIVQRAYRMVPNCSGDTQVNAVYVTDKIHYITQDFLRCQLRQACTVGGAKGTFGFDPHEIGTRSLCSGAAMALFLMDHHPHKTMILGRCSSDAFLVYIRPQVLE